MYYSCESGEGVGWFENIEWTQKFCYSNSHEMMVLSIFANLCVLRHDHHMNDAPQLEAPSFPKLIVFDLDYTLYFMPPLH